MKKVLVVDDEQLSRSKLIRFLQEQPDKYEVIQAENGLEALEKIENEKPDIVFLDIEMPEMNGMDLVQALGPKINFQLIFQTAYSQYAIEAFEKSAVDYLLKPYSKERFDQALQKALTHNENTQVQTKLAQTYQDNKVYLSKVVVKRGVKNTLIPINDIMWFKSESHYTYACTSDFEYIYTEALRDLMQKLDPSQFMQIHRNAIVNVNYIKDVIQGDNMKIVLQNGQEIYVSRSNKKVIKEKLLRTHNPKVINPIEQFA